MEETNPELEAFRRQWREEVTAKVHESSKVPAHGPSKGTSKGARQLPQIPVHKSPKFRDHDDDEDGARTIPALNGTRRSEVETPESSTSRSTEPRTALEHYERAVERENQGNLGDSVNLYRKAFRMDHTVDKKYKSKHFPAPAHTAKHVNPNPSNASVTVPNTAHHSLDGPPQTYKELVAGCAGIAIEPAPPVIEGTPSPPCPIAGLPDEILVHIFTEVAIADVADLVRLAQVCKKLAHVVLAEEQIWKRVCLGNEVGFGAMHYQWQREIQGGPLEIDATPDLEVENELPELQDLSLNKVAPLSREEITESLVNSYRSSWQHMFRTRPRIRFNGCYISTVNYIRPGQASVNQLTWQSPVHIVTYYRYLRFFRDGTVISLLSTDEPADVVHHLTKELQDTHRGGAVLHLPSAVMKNALRGRWRLSNIDDNPEADLKASEGVVFVETEGAFKKYIYRMQLALRSAGKGARNTKLVWQGFWDQNILTDDIGEFTLRNDKAFFFSRVKSYGAGA